MDEIIAQIKEKLKSALSGRVRGFYLGNSDEVSIPQNKFPFISIFVDNISLETEDTASWNVRANIVIQVSVKQGKYFKDKAQITSIKELLAIVSGRDESGTYGSFGKNTVLGVITEKNFANDLGGWITSINYSDTPATREETNTIEGFVEIELMFLSKNFSQLNN